MFIRSRARNDRKIQLCVHFCPYDFLKFFLDFPSFIWAQHRVLFLLACYGTQNKHKGSRIFPYSFFSLFGFPSLPFPSILLSFFTSFLFFNCYCQRLLFNFKPLSEWAARNSHSYGNYRSRYFSGGEKLSRTFILYSSFTSQTHMYWFLPDFASTYCKIIASFLILNIIISF